MKLYEDKDLFNQIINVIAKDKGINEAIIEKDYFVSLILGEIAKENKNIVFKGGTSLSKCYNAINRFSEDIDISCEGKLSQKEIKKINHSIVECIKKLKFNLKNEDKILSGMDYNKFEIEYPSIYQFNGLKQNVIVETVFSIGAFPCEERLATNIIYNYIEEKGLMDKVNFSELKPFLIQTQTIERTFVDKVFALCDYYLNKDITEHSRHLYDIHKIFANIEINDKLKDFIKEIRTIRMNKRFCTSAQSQYNINDLLKEIIDKNIYKQDFAEVTLKIVYDNVKYEDTTKVIEKIIEFNIF